VSCEDEIVTEETQSFQKSEEEPGGGSECDFDVHGIYFNNRVPKKSDHNILHFPSWENYEILLAALEQEVEDFDDAFINSHPNLSDDQLDAMEDSTGFNDQLPMEEFEIYHDFYSLRKSSYDAENAWLALSNQPGWSWDDNPSDNDVISGVEQTFWNPQNEIIVCNIIYKYVEGGILHVPIGHPNASDILASGNEGVDIEEIMSNLGGTTDPKDYDAFKPFGEVFPPNTANCIYNINETERFTHPQNSNRRVDGKHKLRTGPVNKVYKSITKSYKRKNGKWKKRRTNISAGFDGDFHDPSIGCGTNVYRMVGRTAKKTKRREYSDRIFRIGIVPSEVGCEVNRLSSTHNQGNFTNFYVID
jgi:hypothetical protein